MMMKPSGWWLPPCHWVFKTLVWVAPGTMMMKPSVWWLPPCHWVFKTLVWVAAGTMMMKPRGWWLRSCHWGFKTLVWVAAGTMMMKPRGWWPQSCHWGFKTLVWVAAGTMMMKPRGWWLPQCQWGQLMEYFYFIIWINYRSQGAGCVQIEVLTANNQNLFSGHIFTEPVPHNKIYKKMLYMLSCLWKVHINLFLLFICKKTIICTFP